MNFIEEFFGENRGILSELLMNAGFTAEQSSQFLPAAGSAILKAYQHKDIEEIIATMGLDQPTKLLSEVKIGAITNNIGMNAYQVTSGFEVIMPVMAKAFLNNKAGIVNAAASIAWGLHGDFHNLDKKTVQ